MQWDSGTLANLTVSGSKEVVPVVQALQAV